jgi:integrase
LLERFMGTIKLTKRSIETLVKSGKEQLWWDSELRGFGMKVTTKGTKIFVVQYRMGGRGAVTRRYTIGNLEPWDVPTARAEAERLLRLVASGKDPQQIEKDRQRDEIDLAFPKYAERFLADYGARHWRPRTFQSRAADLRRWVVPALKTKSLPTITRRDIARVFDGLPVDFPALPRNVFAVTRKLFSWAQQRGDIARSPCEGMKSPRAVPSRERVLDDEELMLIAAMSFSLGEPFCSFVHMLLLTGQRRDEVASMTWDELDQESGEWRIPGRRTKNGKDHVIPLGELAIRSLNHVAQRDRWPRRGLVFSTTGTTPISGFSRMKKRLDGWVRRMADHRVISEWRLHDFRRTMATNLQRLGVRFEVTEALLNHVGSARSGVAGVYQRYDWHSEKRKAIKDWDERIQEMVERFTEEVARSGGEHGNEPKIGHIIRDGRAIRVVIPRSNRER